MNKKKWFSIIAMLSIVIALAMFTAIKKENAVHDFFWIPLVSGAVFLFAATRVK